MVDPGGLASALVLYLSAAAGACGAGVVQRVSDETSDAAVGLGLRLARRLFSSSRSSQVQAAVVDVAARPGDEVLIDLLRAQVRAVLAAEPALAVEVATMLADATGRKFTVTVSGSHGVQVGDGNTQTNNFTGPPR